VAPAPDCAIRENVIAPKTNPHAAQHANRFFISLPCPSKESLTIVQPAPPAWEAGHSCDVENRSSLPNEIFSRRKNLK
jgi:hypothetical protein